MIFPSRARSTYSMAFLLNDNRPQGEKIQLFFN
jgi:hypothetical protein